MHIVKICVPRSLESDENERNGSELRTQKKIARDGAPKSKVCLSLCVATEYGGAAFYQPDATSDQKITRSAMLKPPNRKMKSEEKQNYKTEENDKKLPSPAKMFHHTILSCKT